MTVTEELTQHIENLSTTGQVGVDVITYSLRADGYSDEEISAAYESILAQGRYKFEVIRGLGYFQPKEEQ